MTEENDTFTVFQCCLTKMLLQMFQTSFTQMQITGHSTVHAEYSWRYTGGQV